MPDPINYTSGFSDLPSPVQSFAQGVQLSSGLQQMEAARQQQIAAQQAAQQKQADLFALSTKANPTAQDYASIMLKYPDLKDAFKSSWDTQSAGQKQARLARIAPVYAAVNAGRFDIANTLLDQQGQALRNGGAAPEDIASHDAIATLVRENPSQARNAMGLTLSSIMDPDKFATTYSTVGKEGRDNEQGPADLAKKEADARDAANKATISGVDAAYAPIKVPTDIRNTNSQIAERGGRLALDQNKLESEMALKAAELRRKPGAIDLSPAGEKIVNDAAGAAVLARQSGAQLTDLASQIEQQNLNGFVTAPWEFVKKATGQQGYNTSLRQEYVRLRAGETAKLLPPGPASDKDIEIAMKGFPSENASSEVVVPFLRGMAKLKSYEGQIEDARGEWANSVGSLAKAPRDIEIGGVTVPAGTTFADFIRKTVKTTGAITQAPTAQTADTRSRLFQTYGQ